MPLKLIPSRLTLRLSALGCLAVFTLNAPAQSIALTSAPPEGNAPTWSAPGPRPTQGVHASIDPLALRAQLDGAPLARAGVSLHTYALPIDLPHPSGVMMPCFVAEAPVMDPALAARFPQMRTYLVETADGLASGRIELTQRGLTGMLREPSDLSGRGGAWMIDRWRTGDDRAVVAYWLSDLPGGGDWACHTEAAPIEHDDQDTVTHSRALGERRIARLAMACTGEYGLHHSTLEGNPPNADDPMAAIVTVVARTNVVFEADLATTFILVEDNDQIIHFDPQNDPYPDTCDGLGGSDCSGSLLGPNRTHIGDTIGSSNFDVGHCITRITGGVAYLRSVCGSAKAGGISGIPRGGDIDPLSALVVIHELGHQFGANHTFSGTRGRCGSNARLASAWEAGSGSTPMSYAGGCPVGDEPPSDNVAQFFDPFFHHGSIEEMRDFLGSGSADCLSPIATANTLPEFVSITQTTSIPPGTPFILTASATDDDNQTLTYSWEQFDNGERRPLSGEGSEDNGLGSLFRVFPPVLSGSRSFPRIEDVLAGVPTPGEKLPTFTGTTRKFRVLVRDNAPLAGGAVISDFVDLVIASNASPFAVVSPTEGQTLGAGPANITWSVGNTHLDPIDVASVTIRLSTDDGLSFPTTLGTFPNTGTASVTMPADVASAARLRLDPVGGVFYAISRPFSLVGCIADTNDDGVLSPADFSAWISAYNTQSPACDQNLDGLCTPSDFSAWVANFNAGC